ncbi:hypothetical protein FACS1894219_05760 [Clostridia bacterium]|nr:hypothetical protein FACS1894219_05760 [Clostridia bacterium]
MNYNIGENIKYLRGETQITQEQLAEKLAVSPQAVSKWENGVTAPDIYLLPQIAGFFDVTIDYLFKEDVKIYKNKGERLFAIYSGSHTPENFAKADAEYKKLFAKNNADGEDMRLYGLLNEFRSYDLVKKAEDLYVKSIETGGAKKHAQGQLNLLFANTGRNDEVVERYVKLVQENPDEKSNWVQLVLAYERGNFYEKALETARIALEKFPCDFTLLNSCGNICRTLKKYDEAFIYWRKSNENNSGEFCDNYYSMAFAYGDLKEYEKAREMWRVILNWYEKRGFPAFDEGPAWALKEIAKLTELIGDGE